MLATDQRLHLLTGVFKAARHAIGEFMDGGRIAVLFEKYGIITSTTA